MTGVEDRLTRALAELAASMEPDVPEWTPTLVRVQSTKNPGTPTGGVRGPLLAAAAAVAVLLVGVGVLVRRDAVDQAPANSVALPELPAGSDELVGGGVLWPAQPLVGVDSSRPEGVTEAFARAVLGIKNPTVAVKSALDGSAEVQVASADRPSVTVPVRLQQFEAEWFVTAAGAADALRIEGAGPTQVQLAVPPGAAQAEFIWRTPDSQQRRGLTTSEVRSGTVTVTEPLVVAVVIYRDDEGSFLGVAADAPPLLGRLRTVPSTLPGLPAAENI